MPENDMPLVEVELTQLVYGGNAMGRLPDGRAVFVPFGLPGERVRLRLIEEKRGHAQAELVEVLIPSAERITPRCIHFTVCGGCHYQHITYAAQLEAKRRILVEQLERIGGIQSPPVAEMVPSEHEWYYRNHLQFHLTRDGRLGYQAFHSNLVIPIQECHLPEPILNDLWPHLAVEALPGLERVALRTGNGDEVLLNLESTESELPELDLDIGLSVVHSTPSGSVVMAGDDHFTIVVMERLFRVSAGSFFQVNTIQAEGMVKHLLENLPLEKDATLLELYCGVGFFSAFLAPQVKRLVGVEQSTSACDDFVVNLDEFDHVELYQGAAEDVLPGLELEVDILLVDPPRAGIDRRAMDAILNLEPKYMAYISCDPSTLARDLKRLLAHGYRLEIVTPFDLFPQTYHVESIVLMSKLS